MAEAIPVYTSRSQYLSGLDCAHMRALNYHSDGVGGWVGSGGGLQPGGLVPAKQPSYFQLGTNLHNALEAVSIGVDPYTVQSQIWEFESLADNLDFGSSNEIDPKIGVREGATFIEAAMWAYLDVALPRLLAEYSVEQVEYEINVPLKSLPCAHSPTTPDPLLALLECTYCAGTGERPLIWQSKPDMILRRKRDKALFVLDFKSSGQKHSGADLEKQFQHSTLVQAQMASVEYAFSEDCLGFIYQGIYKGYRERKVNKILGYKRQVSPLVYAYCDTTIADGLSKPVTSHDNWRTGPPKLLADLPMSIREYVLSLPQEVKEAQFMLTAAPIGFDPAKVKQWRDEVWAEERRWVTPTAPFPSNDNHCFRYGVNHSCMYLSCCYSANVKADPLGSGLYVPRVPHHEIPKET